MKLSSFFSLRLGLSTNSDLIICGKLAVFQHKVMAVKMKLAEEHEASLADNPALIAVIKDIG